MDENAGLEAVSEEVQETGSEVAEVAPEVKPDEFEMPEKYRGKSLKAVFDDLEHANKSMGRYANELGELRKLTDELIKSQLKPKDVEPVKEVDFFENPHEAIRRQIANDPDVVEAKKTALEIRQAQTKARFDQKHPDASAIAQDPDFVEWVKKSKVRTDLYLRGNAFDFDAADELFGTYKELKSLRAPRTPEVTEEEKASRNKALSAAAVETGGTGETTKKILRRSDILKLMMNPAKYRERKAEIELAYAEGRVR